MKKILFLVASVMLAACFTGCKEKAAENTTESDTTKTSVDTTASKPAPQVDTVAVKTVSKQEVFDAYVAKINAAKRRGGDMNCYACVDMDNDGTPELFLETGTCEADAEYVIYGFQDGAIKKLFTDGAGHTGFQRGKGYVIAYWGLQGCFEINKLTLVNGKIHKKKIAGGEDMDDYPDRPEPDMTKNSLSNLSPLKKAVGL